MKIIDFDLIVNQVIDGQWGDDGNVVYNNLSSTFGPVTSKIIQEIVFERTMKQKEIKSGVKREDKPIEENKTIPLSETLNILTTLNTIKESSNTIYNRNIRDNTSELSIIASCNAVINELVKRIKESI